MLRLQQDVPTAYLLPPTLPHVLPVELLLFAAAVLAQRDPAHHCFSIHAAAVVDGDQQRDVGQLEQRHLEDEHLLVDGVGLTATHRSLAPRDLLTHRVQQRQSSVGVCSDGDKRGGGNSQPKGGASDTSDTLVTLYYDSDNRYKYTTILILNTRGRLLLLSFSSWM